MHFQFTQLFQESDYSENRDKTVFQIATSSYNTVRGFSLFISIGTEQRNVTSWN